MRVITTVAEMAALSEGSHRAGRRVALVPTMGALHAGHFALVDVARTLAEQVVVSIFVNPTQFGPSEDFDRYPRTLQADLDGCRAHGADLVFCPTAAEMYPRGHSVSVQEDALSRPLCGRTRPGHFGGVLTVVSQLFHLVQPHVAVFGQKDAQQARLIRQLVRDLHMPVEVRIAPTVREPDGLAMSSRNRYLDADERRRALCLREALTLGEELFRAGERDAAAVCARMRERCESGLPPVRVEYVEALDYETMEPAKILGAGTLLALCVHVGRTRLIDNVVLGREQVGAAFGFLD